ncbi:hypothetical protein Golax_022740, partial [Gossypium laxum]|nr:hypothetical protein [Gossypium laxum]
MDAICQHRYHILHPSKIVGQSEDVGSKGAIDSVRDGGNARIGTGRPSGENDKYWKEIHNDYIDAWDRMMEFLPIREPFFLADTMSCLEYILWFRVGRGRMTSSSSAPTKEAPHVSMQHLDQLAPLIP